jgi:hypothetical protein
MTTATLTDILLAVFAEGETLAKVIKPLRALADA